MADSGNLPKTEVKQSEIETEKRTPSNRSDGAFYLSLAIRGESAAIFFLARCAREKSKVQARYAGFGWFSIL
jgi:hypothetical protein